MEEHSSFKAHGGTENPKTMEEDKFLKIHQGAENTKAKLELVQLCTGRRNSPFPLGFHALLLPGPLWSWEKHI